MGSEQRAIVRSPSAATNHKPLFVLALLVGSSLLFSKRILPEQSSSAAAVGGGPPPPLYVDGRRDPVGVSHSYADSRRDWSRGRMTQAQPSAPRETRGWRGRSSRTRSVQRQHHHNHHNHHHYHHHRERDERAIPAIPKSTRDYHRLIAKCAADEDAAGALAALEGMKSKNLSIPLTIYNTAMAACQRHWQIATELFETINNYGIRPDNVTYLRTIQACEKAHQWQRAISLVNTAKGSKASSLITTSIYNAALKACKKMLQPLAADALIKDMENMSIVQPDLESFTHVLGAFKRSFNWERAFDLFQKLKRLGYRPDNKIYSATMRAMEASKQWQLVHQLFLEATNNPDVKLDPAIYDSAIAVYHVSKHDDKVLALHSQMAEKRFIPSLTTYNAAIHACVKTKTWEKGIELLSAMLQDKVMPDTGTCNGVLACCSQGAEGHQAWKMVKFMRKHNLNLGRSTYISAIKAMRSSSSWERAWSLVAEMETKAYNSDIDVYNVPLRLLDKISDLSNTWMNAISLVDRMQLFGLEPNSDSYPVYLRACAAGGEWKRATEALMKIMARTNAINDDYLSSDRKGGGNKDVIRINAQDYNCAIRACLAAERWEIAVSLADSMMSMNSGINPNNETYTHKVFALGMMQEWQQALGVIATLRERDARIDRPMYNALISSLMQAGKFQDAEDTLHLMKKKDITPDEYTYTWMLIGYNKYENHRRLIDTFKRAMKAGMELDADGYQALITAYANRTDTWKQALETFEDMKEEDITPLPETFGKIMQIHVKLDDPTAALSTLKEMTNSTSMPSFVAYKDLLEVTERQSPDDAARWKPIIEAFEQLTKGRRQDAIEIVRDAGLWANFEQEKWKGRDGTVKEGEDALSRANRIMGVAPLPKYDPTLTVGTKNLKVSSDPILSEMQTKKSVVAVPKSLEMIPLHPDFELPDKDDPRYIETVIRAKLRWKDETRRTCYVGNLQQELTETMLVEFLSSVGKVSCLAPRRNLETPVGMTASAYVEPSWFTFVEFETAKGADLAIQLGGYVLGDRPIKVGRANQPIVRSLVPGGSSGGGAATGGLGGGANGMMDTGLDGGAGDDYVPSVEEIDQKLPEILQIIEGNMGNDAAMAGDTKEVKTANLYKELENQVDQQRVRPKTSSERKKERKEKRRRSISREYHRKTRALQLQKELEKIPAPTPAPKRKDPHEGKFFNGWTWIPKDQAPEWVQASQIATLHHLKNTMTPGMASLRPQEQVLPPGIVASVEAENARLSGRTGGQPSVQFSGTTAFSSEPAAKQPKVAGGG